MQTHHGFTLLELAIVLALLGLLLALSLPQLHRARQQAAVRAARAELAGAFTVARATAVLAGGATLYIDPAQGRAWIQAANGERQHVEYPLAERYGVVVETERNTTLGVRYDALGIGRLANATVSVRRGDVRATITISAYGRVRL